MSDKLCVELCSGSARLAHAFGDAGWEAITVDIDPKTNPTICADVQTLSARDIILAMKRPAFSDYREVFVAMAPPCNATSRANPNGWLRTIGPYLRIGAACTDIARDILQAKGHGFFMLEQPDGRAHWFYGTPSFIINLGDFGKPTKKRSQIWTNVPLGLIPASVFRKPQTHRSRKEIHHNELERTPAQRAAYPLPFVNAVLEAVESQP